MFHKLKVICQDFGNLLIMIWIGSLGHVDLICERNFGNFFLLFYYSFFVLFRPNTSFDFEKMKPQAIVWRKVIQLFIGQPWVALLFLYWQESNTAITLTSRHCSEWALLVDEAWREMRPFSECIEKTQIKMPISWNVLAISK